MEILVIGQGAREHAIVRTLLKDDGVVVHCAPGNPGIARDVTTHPVDATNSESVVALAQFLDVDLVVIGPEAPLVAGVADALRAADFAVFGPSRAAAQLEGSKAFAKEIMKAAGVPIVFGPGRHLPSTSIFLYFLDPDGNTNEFSFGMELFEEEGARGPRELEHKAEVMDTWGSKPDPRFGKGNPILSPREPVHG